jgi:hypothetical protein
MKLMKRQAFAALALSFALAGIAEADDVAVVTQKIEDIEVFERVVLGRGLRPDWAITQLDLLTTEDLAIQIMISPATSATDDLASTAENIAEKIQQVGSLTTGRQIRGAVTVKRGDDLDKDCEAFLKSGSDTGGRNVILVAIGADAQRCVDASERSPLSFAKSPIDPDVVDKDLSVRLGCISRSRTAADGRGKMAVIAAIPAKNKGDTYLLRFCLFDRAFSFFGFRGRLFYDAVAVEDRIETLRSVPKPAFQPSTADLLMLAIAYQYLGQDDDYTMMRDKIKHALPPLK